MRAWILAGLLVAVSWSAAIAGAEHLDSECETHDHADLTIPDDSGEDAYHVYVRDQNFVSVYEESNDVTGLQPGDTNDVGDAGVLQYSDDHGHASNCGHGTDTLIL